MAELALREKQIQQNYRPIISVHKWFARRPGALFRSLLLSEFTQPPLKENYFKSNNLSGIRVADPFMGGGIPLLEANRLSCDVTGSDINPMAYWIVRQELEHLNLPDYIEISRQVIHRLKKEIGHLYRTQCLHCGQENAQVKYYLWIKTRICTNCNSRIDLFPGYLLAKNQRHPKYVFICPKCGELVETADRKNPGSCNRCRTALSEEGTARRNRCTCPHCSCSNTYPDPENGPPTHRLFAIEYHCAACRPQHRGRFFKKPDHTDLGHYEEAESLLSNLHPTCVPADEIPGGDETDRLLRWGYKHYREMFNARQLLGLELSGRAILNVPDERIRNALATNLSDLLRYQNMLCRYDSMALKSLDIFSVHGFPVGLIQCESNLLGISNSNNGINIGSGGWSNIVDKYIKAKSYCDHPFEIKHVNKKKVQIPIHEEWIGDKKNNGKTGQPRIISIRCMSSTQLEIPPASLDAVLTDPPYLGNVQYAELMDFCYVWLRRLLSDKIPAFRLPSTRNPGELTGNITMNRGLSHFTRGLSDVFVRMARALKPGAPLAFTYHHNRLEAYYPVAIAILDAGLTCTASLPCPAEMGGSIHINKTGSSIVDTVFICRSTGKIPRNLIVDGPERIATLIQNDIDSLCNGRVTPTRGDIKCIIFGHLTRLAIWNLRKSWQHNVPTETKIQNAAACIEEIGNLEDIEHHLQSSLSQTPKSQNAISRESPVDYRIDEDEISF